MLGESATSDQPGQYTHNTKPEGKQNKDKFYVAWFQALVRIQVYQEDRK